MSVDGDQQGNQVFMDAENYIKQASEMLQREAARLRHEKEAIDAMSKKLEHVHFSSTIQLNVGGHRFTTSLQTLTKDPNSMLAAMFSGKFEMKPSDDGAFFIDRDGTHFRFILNYLRTGKLTLPVGATFLDELAEEAEFYQIQGILDELASKAPK
ncbi:BTB/POZ domain-containing protein KCTD6-like [Stylophora pistillata]|uniref:BTB/POZ domain-containing protein KCTD6-like n=1 Tax=Stylophora pistillata TaxID=50429 RepID=UPI000C053B53|nr:BTB/POZ domain-containing protein KCTD6-like [Stylophora pistillata]